MRRSVDEFDVDLGAVLGGGGTHHGPDGMGGTTAPTDHTTGVAVADGHVQFVTVAVTFDVDAHGVGVTDDGLADELAHGDCGGNRVGAHEAVAASASLSATSALRWNCSAPSGSGSPLRVAIAPDSVNSLPTVSLGWAPLRSQ